MISVSLAVEDKALREDVRACLIQERVQIECEQSQVADLSNFLDKIRHFRPDLVLIDVSTLGGSVAAAMHEVRLSSPGSFLVALNTVEPTAACVLECLRAGANEYLFPPLAAGLKTVLDGRVEEKARDESITGGRTLTFFSAKGGCGATTIACHVAAELGRMSFKTLLADFDMDAGSVGFLMKCASPYSIADAFRNINRLDESFWGALVCSRNPSLDVVSAPETVAEKQKPAPEQISTVLKFAKTRYQWTVADLGRGLCEATLAGLNNTSGVCLVTTLEIQALHHCKLTIQAILDYGIPAERLYLILNRVPRHADLSLADLQKTIGFPVYAALSDSAESLQESYVQGQLLPAASELSRQISRLTRKLAGVEEPKSSLRFSLFRQGATQ